MPLAADRLGTSRQAVQRIANELVDEGLAAFDDNPRHLRSPFLHLTADGHHTLGAITERAREHDRAIRNDLPGVDVAEIRTALRVLTTAVRAQLLA